MELACDVERFDVGITGEAMLIERWRDGDSEALDQLIRDNMPYLERMALRLTRDPCLASDVVSDTLLKVYRAAHKFRGTARFRTWVFRILMNCVRDAKRKAKQQAAYDIDSRHEDEEGSTLIRQIPDPSGTPFDRSSLRETSEALSRAVNGLDSQQRLLILLFHSEELGYREIAEQAGIPVGTVKSRLHRARQNVKSKLHLEDSHETKQRRAS